MTEEEEEEENKKKEETYGNISVISGGSYEPRGGTSGIFHRCNTPGHHSQGHLPVLQWGGRVGGGLCLSQGQLWPQRGDSLIFLHALTTWMSPTGNRYLLTMYGSVACWYYRGELELGGGLFLTWRQLWIQRGDPWRFF